jgi:LacI family transcriptional regulator
MNVRMKDIARDLGVSVVTVSKVLRNHSDISETTKKRVLRRVKELNYRPNIAARSLVTGRTFAVGLVVPSLVHPFFAELAKGMAGALRDSGYGVLIASSEERADLERQAIDQMLARRVDVLLVASSQTTVETFRRIEEHNTPYILIDRKFEGLSANFVGIDDEMAGLLGTEHLIEVGCKRIAHIAGTHVSPALGRLAGYKKALAKHGFVENPKYIATADQIDDRAVASGYRAAQTLLRCDPIPDGIFCFNDPVALGAMRAILDHGLRIPQDIALVGCANLPYDDFLRVPLTSVDQQSLLIGQRAAKLAMAVVSAKSRTTPKSIVLLPKVIVRESSKR